MLQVHVKISIELNLGHILLSSNPTPMYVANKGGGGDYVVFYSTFNNISVISWLSVLLLDESGGPGENYRHAISH